MSKKTIYFLCVVNSHTYNLGLEYFKVNEVSLSDVVLIKANGFETKETGWLLSFDSVSSFGVIDKAIDLINSSSLNKLLRSYKIYEFLKKQTPKLEENVIFVFGGYRDIPSIVTYCNLCNVEEVVLVDDGMVVFNILKDRCHSRRPIEPGYLFSKYRPVSDFIRYLLMRFGFRYPLIESLTYFTRFPIADKISSTDRYVRAPSVNLQHEVVVALDEIHFVSQPLVSLGIISSEKFNQALEAISKKFPVIYYFPHRYETALELDSVKKIKNFRIVYSDVSYEEYLIAKREVPGKVVTFYSSVLYTLYDLPITCEFYYIEICLDSMLVNGRERLSSVFDVMNNESRFSRIICI